MPSCFSALNWPRLGDSFTSSVAAILRGGDHPAGGPTASLIFKQARSCPARAGFTSVAGPRFETRVGLAGGLPRERVGAIYCGQGRCPAGPHKPGLAWFDSTARHFWRTRKCSRFSQSAKAADIVTAERIHPTRKPTRRACILCIALLLKTAWDAYCTMTRLSITSMGTSATTGQATSMSSIAPGIPGSIGCRGDLRCILFVQSAGMSSFAAPMRFD